MRYLIEWPSRSGRLLASVVGSARIALACRDGLLAKGAPFVVVTQVAE